MLQLPNKKNRDGWMCNCRSMLSPVICSMPCQQEKLSFFPFHFGWFMGTGRVCVVQCSYECVLAMKFFMFFLTN